VKAPAFFYISFMKIIILEGSTASGKTRSAKELVKIFCGNGIRCLLVEEDKTLMPILHHPNSEISKNHLLKIMNKTLKEKTDVIIFDRLHLTASAMTKSEIKKFEPIEKILLQHEPLLVFLKVKENKIPSRVIDSIKYRQRSWEKRIWEKGTRKQVDQHYIEAQRKIAKKYAQSKLPKIIIDSTDQNYAKIARKIALMRASDIMEDK